MSEWRRVPLGELVDVIDPHPSHRAPDETEYGIPFIGIGDVNEDGTFLEGKGRIVSPKIFDEHAKRYQLTSNTIGFGRVATIGKVIDFQNPTKKVVISPTMALLEPYDKKNREFLLFALQGRDIANQIDRLLTGSTRSSLGIELLRKLEILLPPLDVRRKMSTIFQTVTKQVTQTQSLIDKYTSIKQGMMADLFSRGIDTATGQLRPSFEEAPELYKETEFGWVPKDWEVCLLKDKIKNHGFVQTGPFGSQLHSYEYVESGVPVIMPQDLIGGRVCLDKIARITESKAASLSRHLVKENDVIFSRRGDLTRSAFISCKNSNVGFFCGTGCLLLRASARVIHGGWFSLLYGTSLIQNQVDGLAVGSTMANLNSAILGKLLSPFPSVLEQQLIYNKIDQAECSISKLRNEQSKRTLQKKGLMQDLLTGKVPVPA